MEYLDFAKNNHLLSTQIQNTIDDAYNVIYTHRIYIHNASYDFCINTKDDLDQFITLFSNSTTTSAISAYTLYQLKTATYKYCQHILSCTPKMLDLYIKKTFEYIEEKVSIDENVASILFPSQPANFDILKKAIIFKNDARQGEYFIIYPNIIVNPTLHKQIDEYLSLDSIDPHFDEIPLPYFQYRNECTGCTVIFTKKGGMKRECLECYGSGYKTDSNYWTFYLYMTHDGRVDDYQYNSRDGLIHIIHDNICGMKYINGTSFSELYTLDNYHDNHLLVKRKDNISPSNDNILISDNHLDYEKVYLLKTLNNILSPHVNIKNNNGDGKMYDIVEYTMSSSRRGGRKYRIRFKMTGNPKNTLVIDINSQGSISFPDTHNKKLPNKDLIFAVLKSKEDLFFEWKYIVKSDYHHIDRLKWEHNNSASRMDATNSFYENCLLYLKIINELNN